MSKIKMRVKDGCRYMVNNSWFKGGEVVSVESGVTSPNLIAIKSPKPKAKPKAKSVEL